MQPLSKAALLSLVVVSLGFSWEKIPTNLTDTDLRAIAINPAASSLYIGSASAVYQSTNQGKDFKSILQPTGELKAIRQIYISPKDPARVYAAAEAGLFESKTAGESWNRVYFSSDTDENTALSIIEDNGLLFLGTKNGLFFKSLEETTWRRMAEELKHDPVYFSTQDETFIYFATDKKLFRFKKSDKKLKPIFTVGFGRLEEAVSGSEQADTPEQVIDIKYLDVNPRLNIIFLAAKTGIYYSKTQGEIWERLEATSVPVEELTSLKILSHGCPEGTLSCFSLLAVTTKGAFLYANQHWQTVYQGMETNDIRSAAVDSEQNIYAATNRGLFLLALEKALPSDGQIRDYKTLSEYFTDEPTAREVHDLAIDYAEVHPDKIKDWRKLASKRAIMPALSTGLNRGNTDLYHWDTNSTNVADELRKGKDFVDWDVSLSWDLADLIWNPDQTSIEIRSKEMVKLREDILDQITRLYFERRRAQMELVNLASLKPQTRFDKEMRVEELTALIDAYTGGKFSKEIARRKALREETQGHRTQENSK